MNRALLVAASGMAAQQSNLEIIAHNLANSDVTAFKASVATFAELSAGNARLGTLQTGTHPVLSQGKLVKSGGPFDVAIDGEGFFEVRRGGRIAYTRDGEFARASDGTVCNAAGWTLRGIHIPSDAAAVHVEKDGRVLVDRPHGAVRLAGRIQLSTFASPYALESLGGGLFTATPASGRAMHVAPADDGGPHIVFGALERSNVSIVESMMQILSAQRAYEANAKGVQAADEMLRIVNNLHRD